MRRDISTRGAFTSRLLLITFYFFAAGFAISSFMV